MTRRDEGLKAVARPSRYLGGEIGAVVKNESEVRLKVALAFPDVYEIGMSHVGLSILYGLINRIPEYWAERVMAPWTDHEADLRSSGTRLGSLESGRPLADFDLVGFSLQYELSYTNILNMLDLGGVPVLARDRGPNDPIVVGGGPNAFNPEPLADFFDFFYLGDAEAGLEAVLSRVADWKAARAPRADLLAALAGLPGVYVPSFFEPVYDPAGRLETIRPLRPGYEGVRRAVAPDLDRAFFPGCPILSFTEIVHDRIAVEIARGCTRGCRFCQAGFVYRPVRERGPKTVLDLAQSALAATGRDEVSLLSLSAGDYSALSPLMTAFMDAYASRHVALALPSLRVKSLTRDMMEQIKRVRKTGFTLAPEAGTQRLRDVINKDLTEEDLIRAAQDAFSFGWRLIKLYFMIGLPTETEADILAIADLASKVRAGTKSKVNVSYAVFVPKPMTPFQWEPMLGAEEIGVRMNMLRDRLRSPGLRPKWNQPESSLLEGVLARGDRRLGPVLFRAWERGARFDSWNDHLRADFWREALAEAGLTMDEYLRARDPNEVLPWAHLSSGVSTDYLRAEREKALQGEKTGDCREGDCQGCEACDFSEIQPRLTPVPERMEPIVFPEETGEPMRFRMNFSKTGSVRMLSHLETMQVFQRAVRRAGFQFKMSQGFHPQPRLYFASALPVGQASRDEFLEMELMAPPSAEEVARRLGETLPRGFSLNRVESLLPGIPKIRAVGAVFALEADEPLFDAQVLAEHLTREELEVIRPGKKGFRRIDLKKILGDIQCLTSEKVRLTLFHGETGSVRPEQAAAVLFDLGPEQASTLKVEKLQTLLRNEDHAHGTDHKRP